MKQEIFSLAILLLTLCGCSSDDGLSSVKKSVVGSWQLVERIDGFYPSTQSMPVETNSIMEFRSDGTVVTIVDGEQISEMGYKKIRLERNKLEGLTLEDTWEKIKKINPMKRSSKKT